MSGAKGKKFAHSCALCCETLSLPHAPLCCCLDACLPRYLLVLLVAAHAWCLLATVSPPLPTACPLSPAHQCLSLPIAAHHCRLLAACVAAHHHHLLATPVACRCHLLAMPVACCHLLAMPVAAHHHFL